MPTSNDRPEDAPAERSPRFQARLTARDEQRRREIAEAGSAVTLPEDLQMFLEDHLHISLRRRDNARPLFRLQMRMLLDLIAAERTITQFKHAREELQAKSDLEAKEAANGPAKDEVKA